MNGIRHEQGNAGELVYRQTLATRLTHWIWAVSLFFLLLSGLQIFNAHPVLYVGDQSGFAFNNTVLEIGAQENGGKQTGFVELFGKRFETTGVLGYSGGSERAFPRWATLPSRQDLATGRVIHLFFAWVLVAALLAWLAGAAISGHLKRDILPTLADLRALPNDLKAHLRLSFQHGKNYNVLQKLAYFSVLFVALPMMIATGLAMSPGFNAVAPFMVDLLGGRQTARTLHFVFMAALVGFFVVHIAMILAAGPLNELRSIITGWYRTDTMTLDPKNEVK